MNTARYYVALVILVSFPPAVLWWFLIHPFARFWRRLGPAVTYPLTLSAAFIVGYAIYSSRALLLAVEFSTNRWLWPAAILAYAVSLYIEFRCRKLLSFRVLAGVPELSRSSGGELLTGGIYSRMRHPRYVAVMLSLLALALFSNYLAMYVLCAVLVPALYLVVLLEERELRERFGQRYVDYCDRVPRFPTGRRSGGAPSC